MRSLNLAAIAAVSLLTLGACATPTPYQPAGLSGSHNTGYSDTRLEDNRYRLTFAGNDITRRETVENYLLYHAAELTLNAGFDWFEVVTRDTDTKTRTYTEPRYDNFSWRFYRGSRWGAWGFGWEDDFGRDSIQYSRYEASAEIVMHKGEKSDASNAYDARQVRGNLDSSIVRPEARQDSRSDSRQ